MVKQEKQKRYIFDFYSIASVQQDLFAMSTESAFEKIINGDHPKSYASYGCIREVFGLHYRINTNSYAGQIRKIRKADLPEIGALGKDGKKIELEIDEGVIEKNFSFTTKITPYWLYIGTMMGTLACILRNCLRLALACHFCQPDH